MAYRNSFPKRGAYSPQLVEGQHYDARYLWMTGSVADDIVTAINTYLPSKPWTAVETNADVGVLTMALAESDDVDHVYSFSTVAAWIAETAKLYHLSDKVTLAAQYEGIYSDLINPVMIIWHYYDAYFRNKELDLKTQLESLNQYVKLFVVVTQVGTILPQLKGARIVTWTLPTLNNGQAGSRQIHFISYEKDVIASFDWEAKYLDFTRKQLAIAAPGQGPDMIDRLISFENANHFKLAATHMSFDYTNNYETYETLGDRALDLAFVQYLWEKYKKLTSAMITNLKSYYMSKGTQHSIGDKLGLSAHIRTGLHLDREMAMTWHVREDVYESFFGAILRAGDSVAPGLGNVLVYNYLASYFEANPIDLSRSIGHAKMTSGHILNPLNVRVVTAKDKVTLPGRAGEMERITLQLQGRLPVPMQNTFEGVGATDTAASVDAYEKLLKALLNAGLTREFAHKYRNVQTLKQPAFASYLPQLMERATELGLTELGFEEPASGKGRKGKIVVLVGYKGAHKFTLVSKTLPANLESEAKTKQQQQMLEAFIRDYKAIGSINIRSPARRKEGT